MKTLLPTFAALLLSAVTSFAPSLTLGWNDTNPNWLAPSGYYLMSSNVLSTNIVFSPITSYTYTGTNVPPTNVLTGFWVSATNSMFGLTSAWSAPLFFPYNAPKWTAVLYVP